jgi:hypothetical protein
VAVEAIHCGRLQRGMSRGVVVLQAGAGVGAGAGCPEQVRRVQGGRKGDARRW